MTEQTNPTPGVSQDADTLTRLGNFFAQSEDQAPEEERKPGDAAPEQKAVEQPASQVTEELTPDDLEVEPKTEEQPAVDAFEIVHEGQQVKLSREETIKYAMQGFDYTRKTQALAENQKQLAERAQKLAEVEQVTPHVMQELAQVKALESQLSQWKDVDWVALAGADVQRYAAARAQYDGLKEAHQAASNQLGQKYREVQSKIREFQDSHLRTEDAKLGDVIPEWKDPAKKETGKAELVRYMLSQGATEAGLLQKLNDAVSVATAWKAMQYDRLVKAKSEKVKQLRTVPPVTRPGAAQSQDSARADKTKELTNRLQKSGDVKDAAALLLNRWK